MDSVLVVSDHSDGYAFFGTPAATKSTIFCIFSASIYYFFFFLPFDEAGDVSLFSLAGFKESVEFTVRLVSDMLIYGFSSSYLSFSSFSAALSSIAPS